MKVGVCPSCGYGGFKNVRGEDLMDIVEASYRMCERCGTPIVNGKCNCSD